MSAELSKWLPDEIERKAQVESGVAVIANKYRDKNLVSWASSQGLLVYIGRGGPWGNPFDMKRHGMTRDEVCDKFSEHLSPELAERAGRELKGKVLMCYCYPKRCHGEHLAGIANANEPQQEGF